LAILPRRLRGSLTPLAAPVLLLVTAIALSVVLGWLSYIRGYWILGRQWVGSFALVALAFVWLWGEVVRIASRVSPALGGALWVFPALLIVGQVLRVQDARLADISANLAKSPTLVHSTHCQAPSVEAPPDLGFQTAIADWVQLANRNIECGGSAWPVFRSYYQRHAKQWM
jgi:hypothetical protein